MVRSDNGTEFLCLSSFFREKGIVHQTTCVGTPQQNGRVERKHLHLLNVARSLLFQAQLPTKFWVEAVLNAAHVINLTPTKLLHNKCPHEIRDKDKFVPRSRKCVFVGYPYGKKGWKLYDLENNEFFVSRDVIFKEDEFPFSAQPEPGLPHDVIFNTCDTDWFVDGSATIGIRGSVSNTENRGSPQDSGLVGNVVEPEVEEVSPAELDGAILEVGPILPSGSSAVVDGSTDRNFVVLQPEPDMGQGKCAKIPSVRLKDYVLYNAVASNSANHVLPDLSTSDYCDTVQGTSLYPLTDFITDARFSSRHQAFLAAISAAVEP
ncbi:PREDICTED: uncharacterized protein LOC104743742 [Camelina sativa]|uniref:Uncharacterized protein LOC104743742 n=1 Tax=Camelina sativa TaxID=90675 RepID=A0ABM0VYI7_CAMSA|nr:PREDICTED: uncharacterized protein LOC104743742 [Camelina sativa]